MNKELINKYKTEFDHWLKEGKLLIRSAIEHKYIPLVATNWNLSKDNIIIINDEYVEFRKALAEGKTIQCNRSYGEFYGNPPIWEDIPIQVLNNFCPEFLRIKPEEPEIKVGDWLFDLYYNKYHQIVNVLDEKVETATFRVYKSAINDVDYKIWKPKPGELVIMETDDYTTGFTVTPWEENSKFTPVPFTGELPK